MSPGAGLQEEYRRCLERDFRGGHVGACSDASLKQLLRHHLLEDAELHDSLDGEDTLDTLATALRGHLDLKGALQNLTRAYEVLELAAVNLYFFPWRKEFATIKTFSGVYVHVLKGVLPEADLARSFRRLGYVQDRLHLVNSRLPPGANLLCAACCFFAARVECEILAKIVEELEPRVVAPEELLKARREAKGSLEQCVAKLQSLTCWPRSCEARPDRAAGLDLYREAAEGRSFYREPLGSRLWGQESPSLSECGSPRFLRQSPQPPTECRSEPPWSRESSCGNGLLGSEEPDLAASFSFFSLRRELSRTSEMDFPAQPGSPFSFSAMGGYESSGPPSQAMSRPASPPSRRPRSLHLSPASLHSSTQGLSPKPTHYQKHSCLLPGALPCSCCNTCRLLHVNSCDGVQVCRSRHHLVEELQSEKQQRLWLQRTEVDRLLLQEAAGSWQ